MTMPNLTRSQVERAAPLEFTERAPERQVDITIEVAPDGLHVRCAYTGTLGSIPAAIERLRAAGVLQLVDASRPGAPVSPIGEKSAPAKTSPTYNDAGEACCPVHNKKLNKRPWGWSCSALAKDGQATDPKGYCGLKFTD